MATLKRLTLGSLRQFETLPNLIFTSLQCFHPQHWEILVYISTEGSCDIASCVINVHWCFFLSGYSRSEVESLDWCSLCSLSCVQMSLILSGSGCVSILMCCFSSHGQWECVLWRSVSGQGRTEWSCTRVFVVVFCVALFVAFTCRVQ